LAAAHGDHTAPAVAAGRRVRRAGSLRADALVGLAADALGIGRFAAATTLLTRADAALAAQLPAHVADRLAVRRRWVAAELAMACGEAATAVRRAEEAVELARAMQTPPSVRHQVKSDVVLAAALCSAGAVERARAVAQAALDDTGRFGLIPLRWALACLLIDISSVTLSAQKLREFAEIRDVSAAQVRRAGGNWRSV
jgi:hypothetical protein